MPELPEVETTCNSLLPYCIGQQFTKIILRNPKLRWPVNSNLPKILAAQTILNIRRRAKYLIIACTKGNLIIHLGMSGKLSVVKKDVKLAKHSHVDFILANNYIISPKDC